MVLPMSESRRATLPADLQIRPLQQDEWSTLIEFLQSIGRRRPFFPCYRQDDFEGRSATFQNLPAERILTAWNGRELVGTLGIWEQMPFRQTVVEGYSTWLRWLRPVYNTWALLRRRPQFPRVGRPFRYLTAALPLVRDGDPGVFQALLAAAVGRSRDARQNCLLLGMSTHDPLFAAMRRQAVFAYATQVYTVSWDDKPEEMVEPFVDRDLYLELGCL
jgi:hypothetical protein